MRSTTCSCNFVVTFVQFKINSFRKLFKPSWFRGFSTSSQQSSSWISCSRVDFWPTLKQPVHSQSLAVFAWKETFPETTISNDFSYFQKTLSPWARDSSFVFLEETPRVKNKEALNCLHSFYILAEFQSKLKLGVLSDWFLPF